jgi:hypothetical protein
MPNTPRVEEIADATYTIPAELETTMSFGAVEYTATPVSCCAVQLFDDVLMLDLPNATVPEDTAFSEYVGRSATASATIRLVLLVFWRRKYLVEAVFRSDENLATAFHQSRSTFCRSGERIYVQTI